MELMINLFYIALTLTIITMVIVATAGVLEIKDRLGKRSK